MLPFVPSAIRTTVCLKTKVFSLGWMEITAATGLVGFPLANLRLKVRMLAPMRLRTPEMDRAAADPMKVCRGSQSQEGPK